MHDRSWRVAIVGAGGQLGAELVTAFREATAEVVALTRAEVDLDRADTMHLLTEIRPGVVVNAAAWTDVDGCARDPARAMRTNGVGAGLVAAAATTAGALVVQISTNEVFDGTSDHPYREADAANPINPYGASKLAGEQAVAAANPRHLIVRAAWLFGRTNGAFPGKIRKAAERARSAGEPLRVVADEHGNPTWVPDLAAAVVRATSLAQRGNAPTILHIAGWPPASRLEWARAVLLDLGDLRMESVSRAAFERASRVPERAVLDIEVARSLGIQPSDWRAATARLLAPSGAG